MDIKEQLKKFTFNKYQTPLTDDLLDLLDTKSLEELYEILLKIELVKRMTHPDRQYAKDRPRDEKGRIIVDLENIHILEDMNYFRERVLYYKEHGIYTHILPNPAPGSDYRRFWDEERRRCLEGHVRESDGEWIPGYYYNFLNYSTMYVAQAKKRSDRIPGHPSVYDGHYILFHYLEQCQEEGRHADLLKARGKGLSFIGGSMAERNYHHVRGSRSFIFASETEFLTRDGVLTKCIDDINYVDNQTPFTQPRDYKDTDLHKRASYKDIELKTEKGMMTEIIGVTCKNDPQKGRGKRGKFLFFDENGVFPMIESTWTIARKSVEEGDAVYGLMFTTGTGGTKGANFEGAKKFFQFPTAYNIKDITNLYSKNNGTGRCALFYPEYLNRGFVDSLGKAHEGFCYDKDGNSDITKALVSVLLNFQNVRTKTPSLDSYLQARAEECITPEDAIMAIGRSIFPVTDINDYLREIEGNYHRFISPHYTGRLAKLSTNNIEWVHTEDNVIRSFPLTDNTNKIGCIEIYQMPVKRLNSQGIRYIGGVDTYDDDESQTTSLGSIMIWDLFTDTLVAEYTGRPNTANEFYEICRRLLTFYGAIGNYENNKKGLYAYFANNNCLDLLCDTPEILKDLDYVKGSTFGNKGKGTNATSAINMWGRRLQADWLLQTFEEEVENEETGEVEIINKLNLHKLRSIPYLRELSAWHPDLNCDRISVMNMVMILREEMQKYEYRELERAAKGVAHDPFFQRHMKGSTDVVSGFNWQNVTTEL